MADDIIPTEKVNALSYAPGVISKQGHRVRLTERQIRLKELIEANLKLPNPEPLGKLIVRAGFSVTSSKVPKSIVGTVSFQALIKPTLDRMQRLRGKTLTALEGKDFSQEDLVPLAILLKNLNHDIQLLDNRPTDIHRIEVDENVEKLADAFIKGL